MDALTLEYPVNTDAIKQEKPEPNSPTHSIEHVEVTEVTLTADDVKAEKPDIALPSAEQQEGGWCNLQSAPFGDPIIIAPLEMENSEALETADSNGSYDQPKCEIDEPTETGVMVVPQQSKYRPDADICVRADQVVKAESTTLDQDVPSTKEDIPGRENCDASNTLGDEGGPCGTESKPPSSKQLEKPLYQCAVCSKLFSHSASLKQHMLTHTGEKPYQCTVCSKIVNCSAGLKEHMRTHTGEKPYLCNVCSKLFAHSASLKKHIRSHTGEKPYQCTVCDKFFTCAAGRKQHMYTHTRENPHKCKMCSKSFPRPYLLSNHMHSHREKPYQCTVCSKSFSLSAALEKHMRTHAGEKPYDCIMCSKSFTTYSYLKIHIRTHTGEKPYQCTVCTKTFAATSKLKAHMLTHTEDKTDIGLEADQEGEAESAKLDQHIPSTKDTIHGREKCNASKPVCDEGPCGTESKLPSGKQTVKKPFQCSVCPKSFPYRSIMKVHMRTHTGEKPHQCTLCTKSFITNGRLKTHMFTHAEEKAHQCTDVGLEADQEGETESAKFVQHIPSTEENIHGKETCNASKPLCDKGPCGSESVSTSRKQTVKKQFHCSVCSKSFPFLSNLMVHMQTHTGEKPYQCTLCTKSFVSNGKLKAHMRSHTGEKPHQCTVCFKSFAQSPNLKKHMYSHTGDTPYRCILCSKSFSTSFYLKVHLRTHM